MPRVSANPTPVRLAQVLQGVPVQGMGPGLITEVVYVMLPVAGASGLQGVLRLSYEVDDLHMQFRQLRWLVLGGIGVTALLGLGFGLALAVTITHPIHQVIQRIQAVAAGHYHTRIRLVPL